MKILVRISFILFLFTQGFSVLAQNNRRVSGVVIDSTKAAISRANVLIIAGTDTLKTLSSEDGEFSFSKIKTDTFKLNISSIGYKSYSGKFSFGKEKSLILKDIELKYATNMLKTVEIKGKPNPIKIWTDTVEYDAAAFQVLEGDNIAELIKQFPGLEVDDDLNVKTMGKEMFKLRVNGKDFFTNNIKDFIGKLPAGIVSKVQIIDDYGDQANFTGLKVGEPIKMLNIVTKPGMNKGKFGNVRLNAGSNAQFGSGGNVNFWEDTQQSSANLDYSTSDNGAGTSSSKRFGGNYRNKYGKATNLGISYNFNGFNNAFNSEQSTETLNPLGTFFSTSQNAGESKNNAHNINSDLNFNNKKFFINGVFGASFSGNSAENAFSNSQFGVIRQGQQNSSRSSSKTPNLNGGLNISKRLKKPNNTFSANFNFSTNAQNSDQMINSNTQFYDKDTQILRKDSVLNRNILRESYNQSYIVGLSYGIGLKKPKDSLARRGLNLFYNVTLNHGSSELATFIINGLGSQRRFIDSLSSDYSSLFINQNLGLSYSFSNAKVRYNLGFNARPSSMRNYYRNLNQRINTDVLNYAPTINFSKTISKGKTLSANYGGSSNAPSINQIQPIRNNTNLQNVIIGNPNLKPYFTHRLSTNYNYANLKGGTTVMSGLSFSATQNEIVSNVVVIPDTLNSLKQETRYENANGGYNFSGNYMINMPFKKNKFSISIGGNGGMSNRVIFINNTKRFNKNLNFSQNLRGNIRYKKLSINTSVNYSFTANTNLINQNSINDIFYLNSTQFVTNTFFNTHNFRADFNGSYRSKKWQVSNSINYSINKSDAQINNVGINRVSNFDFMLDSRLVILKTYNWSLSASKRINRGYGVATPNPLIINSTIDKSISKNGSFTLSLGVSDLLGQGTNISRYVSGNSIVDTKSNVITRVFSASLIYNLSVFGGKVMRVNREIYQ